MRQILLVEDDEFIRNLLSEKLVQSDFSVDVAEAGEEALQKLHEQKADAMVLDLELQGMQGIEVLKEIRQKKELQDLPVLIFSNNDDPEAKAECEKYGIAGFFLKIDTDLNDLVARINAAISTT